MQQQHGQEMQELTLFMKQQQQAQESQKEQIEAFGKGQAQVVDVLNTMAQTLNTLREASGADAIISPAIAEAIEEQVELIDGQQEVIEETRDY